MAKMTMRDRILAVVQGRALDRVPFVIYEGQLPNDEVREVLGEDRLGMLRWSRIHRFEHPNCQFESTDYFVGETKWRRTTLYTPVGSLYEERAFEPAYGSSSIRKHYVQEPADYPILWSYLEDVVVLEDFQRYASDARDLGETGVPLVAVERTPYQQLWVQWVGLNNLGYHFADCPDRVEHTIALLREQARQTFEITSLLRPSAPGGSGSIVFRCTMSLRECLLSAMPSSLCIWTAISRRSGRRSGRPRLVGSTRWPPSQITIRRSLAPSRCGQRCVSL